MIRDCGSVVSSARIVFWHGTIDHARAVERAFSSQAESFNASAVANADEILEAIVAHAQPQSSQRWLDAACGPGVVSRRFARTAQSVHGIDVTQAMVTTARREALAAGAENVTFEVGDATRGRCPTRALMVRSPGSPYSTSRCHLACSPSLGGSFALGEASWSWIISPTTMLRIGHGLKRLSESATLPTGRV